MADMNLSQKPSYDDSPDQMGGDENGDNDFNQEKLRSLIPKLSELFAQKEHSNDEIENLKIDHLLMNSLKEFCKLTRMDNDENERHSQSSDGDNVSQSLSNTDAIQNQAEMLDDNLNTIANKIKKLKKEFTNAGSTYPPCKTCHDYVKKPFPKTELPSTASDVDQVEDPEDIEQLKKKEANYKLLIAEQADQIEAYRVRFIDAQETVEEYRCKLEMLECSHKTLEREINAEITKIRRKLCATIEKMKQILLQLDLEREKNSKITEEKKDLTNKLKKTTEELSCLRQQFQKLEDQYKNKHGDPNPNRLKSCLKENKDIKMKLEDLEKEKCCFEKRLQTLTKDFEQYRIETEKIINQNQEFAKIAKDQLKTQICQLELELAKCRACKAISSGFREEGLRDMQKKLLDLTRDFEAAQSQVKALRKTVKKESPTE